MVFLNIMRYFSLIFLLLFIGCSPTKEQLQHSKADTAVFSIIGGEKVALGEEAFYNRWAALLKTKNSVHIFLDPAAHKFKESNIIQHQVTKDKLMPEMSQTLSHLNPQRLIIFIDAHGSTSGNICYKDENICDLSLDFLIEIFKNSETLKLKLKQVLIIPTTCYNKKLMDDFYNKANKYSWPFQIVFINQRQANVCDATTSPANQLLRNEAYLDGHALILKGPKVELSKQAAISTLERFLKIKTLDDFLDLTFMKSSVDSYSFEKRCLPDCAWPIELADFGFNLRTLMPLEIFDQPKKFPKGRTIEQVLEHTYLPKKLYRNIFSLHFYGLNAVDIEINDNFSKIIDKKEKEYSRLDALFLQK